MTLQEALAKLNQLPVADEFTERTKYEIDVETLIRDIYKDFKQGNKPFMAPRQSAWKLTNTSKECKLSTQ